MALSRLDKINEEVNALLNEPEDVLWQVADVTTGVNKGGLLSSFHTISSGTLTEPISPEKGHNKTPGLEPSLNTFLPSRAETSLGLRNQLSGFSLQKAEGSTASLPSSLKAKGTATVRNGRRQWVAKKTIRRIVLGFDIGLEDTCQMALCGIVGRFADSNLNAEKLSVWLERV
jgi:hypothetical protein